MARNRVFLDASYAIALSVETDAHHSAAVQLSRQLESRATFVTTRAVLLEIGNALARSQFRRGLVNLLTDLEADPDVEIVPLSDELYAKGLTLLRTRPDKRWGLTDCISFVVMQERGLLEALTADEHFRQAGFQPLLRNLAN
ncbi:MAG TPA: PIN domain-containing protein [Longimicrobium sp.]